MTANVSFSRPVNKEKKNGEDLCRDFHQASPLYSCLQKMYCRLCAIGLVSVSSKYSQQHQEEIDEVEVQGERTEQCNLLGTFVCAVCCVK